MRWMTAYAFVFSLLGLASGTRAEVPNPMLATSEASASRCAAPARPAVIPPAPAATHDAPSVPVNPYFYAADDDEHSDDDLVIVSVPVAVPTPYASVQVNPYYRSE